MDKKDFKTAADAVKEATAQDEIIDLNADAAPKAVNLTKSKKKKTAPQHINIAVTDDQLTFLKAFCKIRGESYAETVGAMIDRAMRENSELVSLIEKAKAAL